MHRASLLLPVFILLAIQAQGQTTTYKGKKLTPLRSYNDPSLVRAKKGSSVPLFDEAGYPYQGIGIKIGDPLAITFKFYVSEHFALVADFGRSISSFYDDHYSNLFDTYFPDTLAYSSHETESDWVGELKLLYHINAKNVTKGLQFYAGLGWEIRDTKLTYTYTTKEPAEPATLSSTRKHQTQGIEAIIGAEYAGFDAPISFFLDVELYYDLVKNPGWTKLQGGVGIRYIF